MCSSAVVRLEPGPHHHTFTSHYDPPDRPRFESQERCKTLLLCLDASNRSEISPEPLLSRKLALLTMKKTDSCSKEETTGSTPTFRCCPVPVPWPPRRPVGHFGEEQNLVANKNYQHKSRAVVLWHPKFLTAPQSRLSLLGDPFLLMSLPLPKMNVQGTV